MQAIKKGWHQNRSNQRATNSTKDKPGWYEDTGSKHMYNMRRQDQARNTQLRTWTDKPTKSTDNVVVGISFFPWHVYTEFHPQQKQWGGNETWGDRHHYNFIPFHFYSWKLIHIQYRIQTSYPLPLGAAIAVWHQKTTTLWSLNWWIGPEFTNGNVQALSWVVWNEASHTEELIANGAYVSRRKGGKKDKDRKWKAIHDTWAQSTK